MHIIKITDICGRASIRDFVQKYEKLCVGLSMQLADTTETKKTFYAFEKDGDIHGVVCVTSHRMLFHLIPDSSLFTAHDFFPISAECTPYCVSGSAESGVLIEKAISCSTNKMPDCSINYRLQEYAPSQECTQPLLSEQFSHRVGTVTDVTTLFPLRESYELVEVLPPGQSHNKNICRATLTSILSSGKNVTVWDGKTPAGIACINATGTMWNQIGGVFTAEPYRGQGIARFMVQYLANQNCIEGKKTVLFVKETNAPAISAYTKAGFITTGSYRLSYYL